MPLEAGASQRGPIMGPAALRTAGLITALGDLGHEVVDFGDVAPGKVDLPGKAALQMRNVAELAGWTRAVMARAGEILAAGLMPVFLGGDHSMSLGAGAAVVAQAARRGREQFLLWLDAHPDFNTFETSLTGNMHGTPVAFLCGLPGFDALLGGPLATPLDPRNVLMLGIRSADLAERRLIQDYGVAVHDMRAIDEHGIARLLIPFLEMVTKRGGLLHVSLDVDFLDPEIAPGVGTTVPGGVTFREAHLTMELLYDSGLVSSLDLAELNPFLDERGRTARLLTDLTASLFGRRTMDRPTQTPWSG
jgi:arginase